MSEPQEIKDPILLDLPMPIKTSRLLLRSPQPGDGLSVNQAIVESFDQLSKWMSWCREIPPVEETEKNFRAAAAKWIPKDDELRILIFDIKTGQFLGCTGFHQFDWAVPSLHIGYWIRSSRSGEGLVTEAINALTSQYGTAPYWILDRSSRSGESLVTEAINALTRYAFNQIKVARITIQMVTTNIKSKNVAERLGYQLEGTYKFAFRTNDNKLEDIHTYARYGVEGLPSLEVIW